MPKKRDSHRKPDSRSAVEQSLAKLRSYYAAGQESLREHPDRLPYGDASTVSDSQAERLRKARLFADRYTPEDVDRLEKLCREHSTVLGTSLMDRLVSVSDKRKRQKLEREAIKYRWSKNILDREIRERFRRREDRGRTPKPPETPQEALSQLVGILLKLTRWGKAAGWEHERDRILKGVAIEQLPEELLRELRKTLRAAHRLQDAAEDELEKYRSSGS